MYMCICVYVYIYIYMYTHIYICIQCIHVVFLESPTKMQKSRPRAALLGHEPPLDLSLIVNSTPRSVLSDENLHRQTMTQGEPLV